MPSGPQPDGRDAGAGGLLDQHRLLQSLVVELVEDHVDELAIDVGAALVDLELVAHLRHQPERNRDLHRRVTLSPGQRGCHCAIGLPAVGLRVIRDANT